MEEYIEGNDRVENVKGKKSFSEWEALFRILKIPVQ